jgi:hypothetical protein
MLELGQQGFWARHYSLLASVFEKFAIQKFDQVEMNKSEFINLLKECDILIMPAPKKQVEESKNKKGGDDDKKEEEKKVPDRKFDKNDAEAAISTSCSFDLDQLGYIDYLECFLHLVKAYPWN